ncbi:MAG TPA: radical SAM protein, partial [Candidatus Atribacteria bacterium]|nr:radical SAM protein [Candidatus Atribacteria bacterium]
MKVLLINPPAQGIYDTFNIKFPPLGLAYIAAVLKEHNYDVQIIDLNVEENLWEKLNKKWDIVGISGDTSRYPIALKIASQIKKYYHYPIIMGGPHVSFFEKETLDTGVVDYVVRGEGEYTCLNLLNALKKGKDLSTVKGITFMKNGNLIKTTSAPNIENLDKLPFPARELLPMDKYRKL